MSTWKTRGGDAHGNTRHGLSRSPTHNSWVRMRTRCLNPASDRFAYYGGRGITICDRWSVFENFLQDMGERPKGMTLDRIDPNGHYEPSNCRWASAKTQASNTRRNRFLLHGGETLTMTEWARATGVCESFARRRLKRGLTVTQVIAEWQERHAAKQAA